MLHWQSMIAMQEALGLLIVIKPGALPSGIIHESLSTVPTQGGPFNAPKRWLPHLSRASEYNEALCNGYSRISCILSALAL